MKKSIRFALTKKCILKKNMEWYYEKFSNFSL